MPIAMVQQLPAGAALRVFLEPEAGASAWRVLRRQDMAFAGPDDAGAARVFDSAVLTSFVDVNFLENGKTYNYCLYCLVGADWVASPIVSGTPAFTIEDEGVNVLALLQDRLDVGLNAYVAAGRLIHKAGRIAVLSAPPVYDDTNWPVVTLHTSSDASGERAIGESIDLDSEPDDDGMVTEREGWLSRWSLTVVAWSLNPDERMSLRHLIRAIVIANLPVFEASGIQQVDLSQEDTEDFASFDAPVYQCVSTFRCLAPAVVSNKVEAIKNISMSIDPKPQQVRGFGKPYPPINKLHYQ